MADLKLPRRDSSPNIDPASSYATVYDAKGESQLLPRIVAKSIFAGPKGRDVPFTYDPAEAANAKWIAKWAPKAKRTRKPVPAVAVPDPEPEPSPPETEEPALPPEDPPAFVKHGSKSKRGSAKE